MDLNKGGDYSNLPWFSQNLEKRFYALYIVAGKGTPFQDSSLTLRNELSKETHVLTKQEILLGKGTQEYCSAMWLAVSGFMVMGLVFRLTLANHSDSESFLVVHPFFNQDRCQREGFW